MGLGSLALVQAGWTGDLYYDGGGAAFYCNPFTRDSAASLFARLAHEILVNTGETLAIEVDSAGVITLACSVTFEIYPTGNVATRTGFTGTYTGATTYSGDLAASGIFPPRKGLRLPDPLMATSGRGMVGDGSGGVPGVLSAASSTLQSWDNGMTMPNEGEYDYWHDGRVFGRVLVTGRRRVPLSSIRTVDTVRVDVDVLEVT